MEIIKKNQLFKNIEKKTVTFTAVERTENV